MICAMGKFFKNQSQLIQDFIRHIWGLVLLFNKYLDKNAFRLVAIIVFKMLE